MKYNFIMAFTPICNLHTGAFNGANLIFILSGKSGIIKFELKTNFLFCCILPFQSLCPVGCLSYHQIWIQNNLGFMVSDLNCKYRKLQNWSHTIWSTNDIKLFDVDGSSSNFIPACWGVFFCNLPWFFFVFADRAEAAVSWSSVVQSSTMCRNGCMGNTVYNFAIITNFTYL